MQLRLRFIISLIFILLLSWADVFFAGTAVNKILPVVWHQPVHFLSLLATMGIGYYNWKDYPEKWLASLWLIIYAAVIAILILSAVLYFLHVPHSTVLVTIAVYLRNRFTWPIVFLLWYMLHLMTRLISPIKK